MLTRTASKLVWLSGRRRRSGRSFSVAALSNENDTDKNNSSNKPTLKGKKVTKSQRRAMVEVFVNEYRAMNDGKLPMLTEVHKKVGGNYYNCRNFFQELELRIKRLELNKEHPCLFEAKAVSVSETSFERNTQIEAHKENGREIITEAPQSCLEEDIKINLDSSRSIVGTDKAEAYEIGITPTDLEEELFKYKKKGDLAEGDIVALGSKESTSAMVNGERVSNGERKRIVSEHLLERKIPKEKTGQDEQKSEQENSALTTTAEKDFNASTLWVNIKSFADGLLKIWRKS